MRHVIAAMDEVRRRQQREPSAHGDRRLTGTKFLWLKGDVGPRDFTATSGRQFQNLRGSTLKSARAWAIKEALRHISLPLDPRRAGVLRVLGGEGQASRLTPTIHVTGIIRRHLENSRNYLTHRITNAVTEGLNAKIQSIKCSSRGFRNRERFKLPIYFHCGGLDLERR